MQNGNDLKLEVDSRDDPKGAALHIKDDAQARFRCARVCSRHIGPFPPGGAFDGLQPTVEMSTCRPTFATERFNLVRTDNTHDR